MSLFSPSQPREKWIKKKTSVKLKNVAANHRANDVIIREGAPQILVARFMYGPLDMITLTGNFPVLVALILQKMQYHKDEYRKLMSHHFR